MSGSKKEKSYSNSRAHRHSIFVNHGQKKTKRDTDTESVSSNASTAVPVPPPPPPPPPQQQCPLRPFMEGMFESEGDETKKSMCPLRRVKLSHTLPLCLFVMVNMILVICTLLATSIFRVIISCWDLGKGQSTPMGGFNHQSRPNPILFFTMAVFAFIVSAYYGPDWMSITLRVSTTVGFFIGLLLYLLPGNEAAKLLRKVEMVEITLPEPSTESPTESPTEPGSAAAATDS